MAGIIFAAAEEDYLFIYLGTEHFWLLPRVVIGTGGLTKLSKHWQEEDGEGEFGFNYFLLIVVISAVVVSVGSAAESGCLYFYLFSKMHVGLKCGHITEKSSTTV